MPKTPKILLIDDDEVDRKAVIRAFKNYDPDIQIQVAPDATTGLELFKENNFDCILLDYHLPDMDGLQVLEEMSGENGHPPIPVIMLTGEENVNLAVNAMKDGACDFLVKASDERFKDTMPAAIQRAMSQRRLILEKEKAQAANAAKVEFLSHMSHELRTPLNAILGFSDAMREETFGPLGNQKYYGYIDDISNSGLHLLDIINDILELSKIEAQKYRLDYEDVDLVELINESIRMVEGIGRQSGAALINNVTDAEAIISADRMAIKKVLINILNNAMKFTKEDGTISISLERRNNTMIIVIEDTGIGIPAEDLPQIMEPFVQSDRQKMKVQEGTGLGLPLSKKFMELHGGDLEIQSEVEKGTKVTIQIPINIA